MLVVMPRSFWSKTAEKATRAWQLCCSPPSSSPQRHTPSLSSTLSSPDHSIMAEVRQRAKAADPTVAPAEPTSAKTTKPKKSGFSFTDVLRVLGGILLLNCTLSYFVTSSSLTWGWRPWYSKPGVVASWLVYLPTSPPLPLQTLLAQMLI